MSHFGFAGALAGMNIQGSSQLTQQRLGWKPIQPGLIEDLKVILGK